MSSEEEKIALKKAKECQIAYKQIEYMCKAAMQENMLFEVLNTYAESVVAEQTRLGLFPIEIKTAAVLAKEALWEWDII